MTFHLAIAIAIAVLLRSHGSAILLGRSSSCQKFFGYGRLSNQLPVLVQLPTTVHVRHSNPERTTFSSYNAKKESQSAYGFRLFNSRYDGGSGAQGDDIAEESIIKSCAEEEHMDLISQELSSVDISHIKVLHKPSSHEYIPPFSLRADGGATRTSSASDNRPQMSGDELESNQFGSVFRQCAPYIAMHRGSTIVIHIDSALFGNKKRFDAIVDDISILHLLGVHIVIVAGVRDDLLDEKLIDSGCTLKSYNGIRITDEKTLHLLKEASGSARFEIESSLARGFRGLTSQSGINVVSGNFFYSAKPFGVRDGVDFMYTGEVRRVESDTIKKRLESGDIVLLTSLGYSQSGDVYNVQSESLAAETAARLQAAKIVYLIEDESLVDTRSGKMIQSLRLPQAVALLKSFDTSTTSNACSSPTPILTSKMSTKPALASSSSSSQSVLWALSPTFQQAATPPANSSPDLIRVIAQSVTALNGGVRRAHLVSAKHGALLKELYTRDGAGTLISRDVYEGIRQARASDVRYVEEIIRPLEDEGILVPRSRDQLLKDMADCYLLIRDGAVLACGILKAFLSTHAEICCLAVHPKYRRGGRGETLLAYLERRSLLMGITTVFVLSTRTMQWFEERGFVVSDPSILPPTRNYNSSRGSKVYIKPLGTQRDVDVQEELWNRLTV
jgi:amino-acid N-acetyltransferase